MFLVLMLTALYLSSFAQQEEIKVIGVDTFATVKIHRIREANGNHIELKSCRKENDSLFSQIRRHIGMENNLRASITDLKEANRLGEAALGVKKKALDISEDQLKASQKQVGNLRWQRNGIAGICAVFLLKILVFK